MEKELKAIYDDAEKRWNNGGKEIYEAMQNNPEFMQSSEYKKYMLDNNIQQLEEDFDERYYDVLFL